MIFLIVTSSLALITRYSPAMKQKNLNKYVVSSGGLARCLE
jgi:hypothetical protein